MSIGIFDSGIGGITILSKIIEVLPKENLFFIADQAHVPYAEKSIEHLKDRVKIVSSYLQEEGCNTIVVACNTATVATIKILRKQFSQVNFVGVEPAIKPAAITAKKDILILATKNTLQSKRLQDLIDKFASKKTIHLRDIPEWVNLAESNKINDPQAHQVFDQALQGIDKNQISDVVLACTHYPYFKSVIDKHLPQVIIHDPSAPVANQVKKTHKKVVGGKKNGKLSVYTTSSNNSSIDLLRNLLPFAAKIQSISL